MTVSLPGMSKCESKTNSNMFDVGIVCSMLGFYVCMLGLYVCMSTSERSCCLISPPRPDQRPTRSKKSKTTAQRMGKVNGIRPSMYIYTYIYILVCKHD